MSINKIENPKFLKALTIDELEKLCTDIREFLIETVSQTGGHLGPNLGVVELTVALHKAFNSPKDKIIFDVGHQSYTHKILTGRAKKFPTLRKYNGLKQVKVNMMFGKLGIVRHQYLLQVDLFMREIFYMITIML